MGKYRKFLIMALAAGLVTALMASGVLDHADLAVSDRFYQSRSASDGEIVLVGIDQKALEDIGPYPMWWRPARLCSAVPWRRRRQGSIIWTASP